MVDLIHPFCFIRNYLFKVRIFCIISYYKKTFNVYFVKIERVAFLRLIGRFHRTSGDAANLFIRCEYPDGSYPNYSDLKICMFSCNLLFSCLRFLNNIEL